MGEEMKTPELNELSTSVFKLKYSKLQSRSKLSAPLAVGMRAVCNVHYLYFSAVESVYSLQCMLYTSISQLLICEQCTVFSTCTFQLFTVHYLYISAVGGVCVQCKQQTTCTSLLLVGYVYSELYLYISTVMGVCTVYTGNYLYISAVGGVSVQCSLPVHFNCEGCM